MRHTNASLHEHVLLWCPTAFAGRRTGYMPAYGGVAELGLLQSPEVSCGQRCASQQQIYCCIMNVPTRCCSTQHIIHSAVCTQLYRRLYIQPVIWTLACRNNMSQPTHQIQKEGWDSTAPSYMPPGISAGMLALQRPLHVFPA
jgi:hypothetical protein